MVVTRRLEAKTPVCPAESHENSTSRTMLFNLMEALSEICLFVYYVTKLTFFFLCLKHDKLLKCFEEISLALSRALWNDT